MPLLLQDEFDRLEEAAFITGNGTTPRPGRHPTGSRIDLLESTTMDSSNATGGHKNLLLFDANSFVICERLGTTVVWEPLVASAGGILPSGVNSWFAYRRVWSDTPTATSLRVHNNA